MPMTIFRLFFFLSFFLAFANDDVIKHMEYKLLTNWRVSGEMNLWFFMIYCQFLYCNRLECLEFKFVPIKPFLFFTISLWVEVLLELKSYFEPKVSVNEPKAVPMSA